MINIPAKRAKGRPLNLLFHLLLFQARDVAEWIEHSDVTTMLRIVDENERIKLTPQTISGGLQVNTEYWFLTEDGLYEVLLQSRKPIAKEFKKQVKEILKTIRKHGVYATNDFIEQAISDLQLFLRQQR